MLEDEMDEILTPHLDNILSSLEELAIIIEDIDNDKKRKDLEKYVNLKVKENLFSNEE